MLQEESKEGECFLVETTDNDKKSYECTVETNGEEIDNIKIDKNIESEDDDVDFSDIEVSPMAIKYMNNIQDVGNNDIFNKKLYLLNTSSVTVDDDKNEFNITGNMGVNNFDYNKINLEISLIDNSVEKSETVDCISTKKETNTYNLQCNTDKEMSGVLNNGFANLGDANLMVNIQDFDKKTINFKEIKIQNKTKESSGKLSAGAIVAILIPCILVLIGAVVLGLFYFRKNKTGSTGQIHSSIIIPNSSSYSINKDI